MKQSRRSRLQDSSPEFLEHVAENVKERIYATITLLAVIAGLWQSSAHHTVGGVIGTILGTAVALWLATLIAARMSYRAIHKKSMTPRGYRKLLFTSSGLFAPAVIPMLLMGLSALNIVSLKTALFSSMAALALSLFVLSFTAGLKIYESWGRLIIISGLEMLLGVGVIALKIVLGE